MENYTTSLKEYFEEKLTESIDKIYDLVETGEYEKTEYQEWVEESYEDGMKDENGVYQPHYSSQRVLKTRVVSTPIMKKVLKLDSNSTLEEEKKKFDEDIAGYTKKIYSRWQSKKPHFDEDEFLEECKSIYDKNDELVKKEESNENHTHYSPDKKGVLEIKEGVVLEGEYKNDSTIKGIVIRSGCKAIGSEAFASCPNLRYVLFEEGLEVIPGSAFIGCSKLNKITLPESLLIIGAYAFEGDELRRIDFPEKLKYIGEAAFANNTCISLYFPESIRIIENYAFEGIPTLKSIYLQEGLFVLGMRAFAGCDVKSLHFPLTLTAMGDDCFAGVQTLLVTKLKPSPEGTDYCRDFGAGDVDFIEDYYDKYDEETLNHIRCWDYNTGKGAVYSEEAIKVEKYVYNNFGEGKKKQSIFQLILRGLALGKEDIRWYGYIIRAYLEMLLSILIFFKKLGLIWPIILVFVINYFIGKVLYAYEYKW